ERRASRLIRVTRPPIVSHLQPSKQKNRRGRSCLSLLAFSPLPKLHASSLAVVSKALSRPQGKVHQPSPRPACPIQQVPRIGAALSRRFGISAGAGWKRMCLSSSVIGQQEEEFSRHFWSPLRCLIRRRSAMDIK
ncbi:hypothetical protein CCMA1212_006473, partial [Trichoderma ghanense]